MDFISFEDIITISVTLFVIIDVLGNVPVIIKLKASMPNFKPGEITLFAGALMIAFLFAGESILKALGLDINSFAIAGAIVIFLIALEMILGVKIFKVDPDNTKSGNMVPIGFPLLAGAGTLTILISLRSIYSIMNILIAVGINLILIYVVLRSTGWIERKLSKSGLTAIEKFFGIITLALAIKIIRTNFFPE
ncbi:MAG: MarC family protein [Chitinophagales bacterium]|nr:MarC family protein [Bacteroidota bacterium]MBP8917492.1 MarC family protein [Chitinophagales bacterium]MBP9220708.1 MarC family protein [Chitinophagales bacterium]MBP9795762.1 MarC family protein [Chitinophagales bacterium]